MEFLNLFCNLTGLILESKGMGAIFQKKRRKKTPQKMLKKNKKGWNVWNFAQKCTKFKNILKKRRWLRAIIARNKLLERVLPREWLVASFKPLLFLMILFIKRDWVQKTKIKLNFLRLFDNPLPKYPIFKKISCT